MIPKKVTNVCRSPCAEAPLHQLRLDAFAQPGGPWVAVPGETHTESWTKIWGKDGGRWGKMGKRWEKIGKILENIGK